MNNQALIKNDKDKCAYCKVRTATRNILDSETLLNIPTCDKCYKDKMNIGVKDK